MLNCSHSQFFSQERSSLAATLLLSHKAITGCCIIASFSELPRGFPSPGTADKHLPAWPALCCWRGESHKVSGQVSVLSPICPLHTLLPPTSCPGEGCKEAQDMEGAADCQGVHPGPAARHILLWRGIPPPGLKPRYLWLAAAGLLLHLVVSLLSCLLALRSICRSALHTEQNCPSQASMEGMPSPQSLWTKAIITSAFPSDLFSSCAPHPSFMSVFRGKYSASRLTDEDGLSWKAWICKIIIWDEMSGKGAHLGIKLVSQIKLSKSRINQGICNTEGVHSFFKPIKMPR